MNSNNQQRRFVLCSRTIDYHEDFGTGRCRVPAKIQQELNVRVQSVMQIRFDEATILCAVFPDTSGALEEDEICIDASVFVKKVVDVDILEMATSCTIEFVFPRALCSAIRASPHDLDVLSMGDLPVMKGCIIDANDSVGRRSAIAIEEVRVSYPIAPGSPAVGIVHIDTIVIPAAAGRSRANDGESEVLSVTTAVKEVIKSLVTPAARVFAAAQPSGALLLGPPGIGKTHAVKVAAKLCKAWCAIKVVDLNIPNILADDDPIGKVRVLLDEASNGAEGYVQEEQGPPPDARERPSPTVSTRTTSYESPSKATPVPSSSFSFLTPSPQRASEGHTTTPQGSDRLTPAIGQAGKTPLPQLCLVMLDEVDALGTRNSESEVQRAVKSVLCAWLDNRQRTSEQNSRAGAAPTDPDFSTRRVCLVATSNRADSVDSRLRRGGRLEREVVLAPRVEDRHALLVPLLRRLLGGGEEVEGLDELAAEIASLTGGYVAADIVSLVAKAGELTERNSSSAGAIPALRGRVLLAAQEIGPSCLRGAAIKTPNLTYDDVVGYDDTKRALQRALRTCEPAMAEKMHRFGLHSPGGILLHGPPGNSKTRLILAAASSHRLPVISLSAADVFSPYVGDAEAEVRKAFNIARQASPCVLFFDELDAIVTNRGTGGDGNDGGGSTSVEARVLATVLTEMDGISHDGNGSSSSRGGVTVMAATNRLTAIDPALLRKGRFYQVLEVPLPDAATRTALLEYFAGKCRVGEGRVAQLRALLREGQSGADIENLCREEQISEMRRLLRGGGSSVSRE